MTLGQPLSLPWPSFAPSIKWGLRLNNFRAPQTWVKSLPPVSFLQYPRTEPLVSDSPCFESSHGYLIFKLKRGNQCLIFHNRSPPYKYMTSNRRQFLLKRMPVKGTQVMAVWTVRVKSHRRGQERPGWGLALPLSPFLNTPSASPLPQCWSPFRTTCEPASSSMWSPAGGRVTWSF